MKDRLKNKIVIFYDGECALCNWAVQFLVRKDKYEKFVYIPLQSPLAQNFFENKQVVANESVILLYRDKIYYKSTAILTALKKLGKGWQLLAVFYVVPRKIRDYFYDIVARNRNKWFGKTNYCRLPNKLSNS